ncbi:unnamed protein product [Trifolium pratense]|uniref:Uncharacterized protein n=1 Tax=Trifolium pratense TaxID=57577 RepID=A0ACB0LSI4_TRIPR|nr:unnamed protein product [Trifolium pratense]
MASLYNYQQMDNPNSGFSPSTSRVGNRAIPQALNSSSVLSLRQQMDESNHKMVNTLTSQLRTVFNPLINNTNDSYQLLASQMGRIADFFGAPQMPNQQFRPIQNQVPIQNQNVPENIGAPVNQGHSQVVVQEEPPAQVVVEQIPNQGVVLVNINLNAEVVRNVQQNNFAGQNNLAYLVETILAQNGLNMGLHRPDFVSALFECVLQTELPRGWKIPKITKFAGDTGESTVEHVARYLTEAGDLASVCLKELASVRRKTHESIDDYLNRFRLLKARCFTQVPEHELVEMIAGGLDYSIRKKLDTQYLRDMAQLEDRVRQVERLKAGKARTSKFHKK